MTAFAAISAAVQERIRRFYGRESDIIYPPVADSAFQPAEHRQPGDYYLSLGRLIPYKRVDLAVRAFSAAWAAPGGHRRRAGPRRRWSAWPGPTCAFWAG